MQPISHVVASEPAGPPVAVDDSQPVTKLQIKLADGTRMVARFNHTHTIADVRRFINAYVAVVNIMLSLLLGPHSPPPLLLRRLISFIVFGFFLFVFLLFFCSFWRSARAGSPPYVLMTAFPAKNVIADESQTLEQAKLLNAVVIQKMQ